MKVEIDECFLRVHKDFLWSLSGPADIDQIQMQLFRDYRKSSRGNPDDLR